MAIAAAGLCVACALPIDRHSDRAVPAGHPDYARVVQVRYLGVAGFLIRRGDDVVMTAPLYSNPDLGEEVGGTIRPDLERIQRFHPADAPAADAILVGHAHYDHLMDVASVWQLHPGGAVYGSTTMKNILAPVPGLPLGKVIALDDPADPAHYKVDTRNCAGVLESPGLPGEECPRWPARDGAWEYVKPTVRIRALCARHPNQLPGIHQSPGCAREPRLRPPDTSLDYLEGPPLTYLIDFLDGPNGAPVFRVYFQDVPTDGRLGQVPDDLVRERPIDLALLCVGNWNLVEGQDAQRIVANLRPQHVMLGHWENFFRDQGTPPEPAPLQPVAEYHHIVARELKALHCPQRPSLSLPEPQVLKVFRPLETSCTSR